MIRYLFYSIFLCIAHCAAAQQSVTVRIFRDSVLLLDNTIILGPELRDTAQFTITLEAHLPAAAKNAHQYTIPLQFYCSNQTGKSLLYYHEAVFYHDSRLTYDRREVIRLQAKEQKVMQLTLYRASQPIFSKTGLLQFQVMGGSMLYIPVAFRLVYDQ